MRKLLFIISSQLFLYLIFVFATFNFGWLTDGGLRGGFLFLDFFVAIFVGLTITGWDSGKTPEWLIDKTHSQKVTGIKKYMGELHEELKLYGEAMDLQKRVNEFKTKIK